MSWKYSLIKVAARHKNYISRVFSYLNIINFISILWFGLSHKWWIIWIAPLTILILDFLGYLDCRYKLFREELRHMSSNNPILMGMKKDLEEIKQVITDVKRNRNE